MTRPKFRRSLRVENLESRELLSGPTADQQYMLQLINMSRTSPQATASWIRSHIDINDKATLDHYGVNLEAELTAIGNSKPVQPLAWNEKLAATATFQSNYEAKNQVQTHQGPDEPGLEDRLHNADYTGQIADGENSYAYANSIDHAMKAFLVDWGVSSKGHRGNLLQPGTSSDMTYNEVGIGIVATDVNSSVGPFVMTQDFGRRANSQPQVVGVVYNDNDGDHLYSRGEGKGGMTVEVDDANGKEVAQTQTWDSGGYQIPLAPGSYTVKVLDSSGKPVQYKPITIASENVGADFNLSLASTEPPPPTPDTSDVKVVIDNLRFDPSWQTSWWTWTQNKSNSTNR